MTRQERILAVARDLLPNMPEVWERGHISSAPRTASDGEQVIIRALHELRHGDGTLGALATRVDRDARAAILALIAEAP